MSRWLLRTALSGIILFGLGCSSTASQQVHQPTEERLRTRISALASAEMNGDLSRFRSLFTERARNEVDATETEEEQRKARRAYKEFMQQLRPIVSLIVIELRGTSARAQMREALLTADGSRVTGTYYDHWVFENGDWYVDKTNRTD